MGRPEQRAFTLVELLIVVVVIAVLVALLMPAAHSAWDSAQATQCQVNLGRIWQAMNSRRADKQETLFAAGGGWPGLLAPYLEQGQSVLKCPLGPQRGGAGSAGDSSGDTGGTDGGGGSAGTGGGSTGTDEPSDDQGFTLSDLTFRMFCKDSKASGATSYTTGQYLGTAFVDSDYGIKKEDKGGGKWFYGVDDRMFFLDQTKGQSLDYKDMQFNVWLDGDKISKMEFVTSDQGSGNSYNAFRFEVWMGEEKISDDFVAEQGRVIQFDTGGSGSGGTAASKTNFETGGELLTGFAALGVTKAFDYALNKATYDVDGQRVASIDPRLILILDYGKSVADYESAGAGKRDDWYLFFTDDETKWMDIYHSMLRPTETWLKYMALRHFGKANVLFCDGHIDALGPDELAETNETLWKFGGK
jgi:prepilin-type N-terminal cleavage/methylation domain-containing protein/prepilin-type processing-associated H-X9-DG protein